MLNIDLGINATSNASVSKKASVETTLLVSNDTKFSGMTGEKYTCYTKASQGKLQQQLCLYISPKPVGIRKGDTNFYGDYVIEYENGVGKNDEWVKGINEKACEPFVTKSKSQGLVIGFPIGDIKVSDIINHADTQRMINTLSEKLAKPKLFYIKVVKLGKINAVIFVSKYVATQCSPTICNNVAEVFGTK